MSRYGKYFLQHILYLEDEFCHYYVQGDAWGRQEILDVEYIIFDWEEVAEDWISHCINWDPFNTIDHLRNFLADDCLTQYMVHRMNNHQVVRTAANELCLNAYRMVVEPKIGWAVRIEPETDEVTQPITVEAAPDFDDILGELKSELDGLVAEQKREYEKWEAKLSKMSDSEKAALYGKKSGSTLFDATIGTGVDMVKMSATQMWKVYTYPKRLADISAEAIRTGSWEPLQNEIKSKINPMVRGAQQAKHYTSMTMVLLGEPQTRDMLIDFADRYWDNTHPIQKVQWGVEAGSELIIGILLLIFTAGAGTAANIAAKSGRVIKLAKLLEKVAGTLKRVKSPTRLPKLRKGRTNGRGKPRAEPKIGTKGPEQPKAPEKGRDVDGKDKSGYSDDNDASRKTRRTGVGVTGEGIPIERVKPGVLKKVDPDSKAAYGYSPKKGTAYEKFDFTDVEAAKKNRALRVEYLDGSKRIENDIKSMRAKGTTSEEIGRHVVYERNLQKVDARKYMKPEEIKILEKRNLKKYNNPIGPTADDLFKGTKENLIDKGLYESDAQVWEQVIGKSMKKDDVINTLLGIEY